MEDRLPRKLAAILYADVADYSRLTDEDEEGTHRRLSAYLDAFTATIERYDGRVVHFAGDAILAEFSSVSQALTCAVVVQQDFNARNGELPEGRRVRFRIGVNLGEVIVDRNDIYGDGVNVAARLEGLADPGGICISEAAHSAVKKQLNLNFVDMGAQAVKNISEPIRVHKVVMEEEASPAESSKSPSLKFPDKPSIAVLPFVNMSMDSDQEYLADGITEDILTGLSRARWLVVASRSSSFAYKGKNTDVKRIAKELGVRYILEGSVRIAGSHTRITGQLIDASTDRHIWAERYDRELEDIFDLQDEITETILGTIEPELGLAEQERARRKAPDSLDAWDLYLRGQWHLYRFRPADNAEAQQFFRQAIEVDPNFAASHTGLAYACHLAAIEAFDDDPGKVIQAGIEAARRAVSLDDKDAMSFSVLARISTMGREHDAAIAAGQMGVDLNPNIAQVRFGYAFALVFSNRFDEALTELDKVVKLSPRDPNVWSFWTVRSWALCALGQYEVAVESARRALEQPRSFMWPNATLATALGHLGKIDEAAQALRQFHRNNPQTDLELLWRRLPFKNPAHVHRLIEGIRKIQYQE